MSENNVPDSSVEVTDAATTQVSEAPANESESTAITLDPSAPELKSQGGPINLARIRELRLRQQQAAEQSSRPKAKHHQKQPQSKHVGGSGHASETVSAGSPDHSSSNEAPSGSDSAVSTGATEAHAGAAQGSGKKHRGKPQHEYVRIETAPRVAPKVQVPSRRAPLPSDLEDELNSVLHSDLDLDKVLVGDAMLQVGHQLDDGQRIQATVVKLNDEFVFVALGGANEGVLSILQFTNPPNVGDQFDVVVRGFSRDEGLYELTIPGNAVDVADWSEIKEGETVEAVVTGANAGGLECNVGTIRGFIPASQVALYRVENFGDFVGQKLLCVITEANERRGNLVLSHRAVLERDRVEQRAERFAALEVGSAVTGTVRKIMDFGAFVDIGGVDGLLHVSQLSWERVNHPNEVLEVGQQIQVRIDKIDPQTGKISLSLRSLQEHPWANVQSCFPVGSIQKGTVTRIAEFGAFVKLATGVEGLVHVSELAHHRVAKTQNVVSEGQEVEVKVLSIDEEKQRISLSIKGAQAAPVESAEETTEAESMEAAPIRPVIKHRGPLKGGIGSSSGGEQFGLKW